MLAQQTEYVDSFTAYVFGSVLSGGAGWADVDLLIVINRPRDYDWLRNALVPLSSVVPLHVTIVLNLEFDELGADAWGTLHKLAAW